MSQRVLITGGRTYGVAPPNATEKERFKADIERAALFALLDKALRHGRVAVILHGAAPGADSLAGEWAAKHCVPVEVYPAEWDKHGRRAGPLRNQRMLDEGKPDVVVATVGGVGTEDMVRRARRADVRVVEV